MWWNYRKPRPVTPGAYRFAVNNNVPVLPMFITLKDTDKIGADWITDLPKINKLAVYADVNTVPEIGSLRSARIVASDLAAGMNSIFIHYGRNARVPEHISQYGIDHIDGNIHFKILLN